MPFFARKMLKKWGFILVPFSAILLTLERLSDYQIIGISNNRMRGQLFLISEITDKEMISALNLNFDKKQNTKKPMNFSDVLEMFMPGGLKKKTTNFQESEA